MKALMLVALMAVPSFARDLSPSLGVSYDKLSLNTDPDVMNVFQNYQTQNITFDINIPLSQMFDLTIAGGPSQMSFDTWDRIYTLRTVTIDPNGNIFGNYGETGATKRRQTLNGYNFKVSVRWYFKK